MKEGYATLIKDGPMYNMYCLKCNEDTDQIGIERQYSIELKAKIVIAQCVKCGNVNASNTTRRMWML